jgi:phosphate transport system ATP-binding protein
MNTVETKNSLKQDTTVNSEQSQFTSTEHQQKQANTSFVSQFESSTPKKEKNTTVKLSAEMYMFTMVNQKRLKVLIFKFMKMK